MKIWKYIIIRYLVTLLIFFMFIYTAWHFEGCGSLSCFFSSFENWFMFFWLFILPILFECLYQGLLLTYCLKKLTRRNELIILFIISLLFFLEFKVTIQIFSIHFVCTKLIVSVILFFVFYGKVIINKRKTNNINNY